MIFNLLLCASIILIYLLTRIGRLNKKLKDRIFLIATMILIFLVIATREMTIGNDTESYLRLFKNSSIYGWDYLLMNHYYEGGYVVFNVLLGYLHISPRAFLTIMALIFSVAVYKFIKNNSNNYLMSVLMFVNLMFLYQSMNIMRQFLALSIVLLFGFKFVKEKKLIGFIISILFATLIHSSALIALFIYPIYQIKYSKKIAIFVILCSVIMTFLLSYVYPLLASSLDRETYYVGTIGEAKLANYIMMLMYLLMYVFSLIVIKKGKRRDYGFYYYIFLFSAAIYCVSTNMPVLNRATQYYAIFSIVALPNIIEANIKKSKIVLESIIVSLFVVYSSVIMVNRPEWNSAYNYKSCLFYEEGYICE